MTYYRTLHLEKEPFSNSPDPGLFFHSRQHWHVLQKLELSLRLRRGLNVVTGDVGTGKTTVCRQLIRKISNDKKIRHFLILDPGFASPLEFLACIYRHFAGIDPEERLEDDALSLKEKIKTDLFSHGVDKDMTTVLLIDEGQKLPVSCLETLRELLNYETNDKKLLQIVIFAQKEFDPMVADMENFVDRINFRYTFSPLGFAETRNLIRFRISSSASPEYFDSSDLPRFTFSGFWAVYRITRGYPRKIINLCHDVILAMIIRNQPVAGSYFVHHCGAEVFPHDRKTKVSMMPAVSLAAAVLILLVAINSGMLFDNRLFGWLSGATGPVAAGLHAEQNMPVQQAMAAPATVIRPILRAPVPKAAPVTTAPPVNPVHEPILAEESHMPGPGANAIENIGPAADMPLLLGTVTVGGQETLYSMITAIYGSCSLDFINQVLAQNPGIENPNWVMKGQHIHFPVIRTSTYPWTKDKACLSAGRFLNFGQAYDKTRQCIQEGLDARILPAWNRSTGFVFYVVMDRVFADARTARFFLFHQPASAWMFKETHIADLIQDRKIL